MKTPSYNITRPRAPVPGNIRGAGLPPAPQIPAQEPIRSKREPRPQSKKPLPRPPNR
jgi:hypothetical protein